MNLEAVRRTLVTLGIALAAWTSIIVLARFESAALGPLGDLEIVIGEALARAGRAGPDVAELDRRAALLRASGDKRTLGALRSGERRLTGLWDPTLLTTRDRLGALEMSFQHRFQVIGIYVGWSRGGSGEFPLQEAEQIWRAGSVPLVTWEPWVSALDDSAPANGKDSLLHISQGKYDAYVDEFAKAAVAFGRPVYLRFAHEMNDPYRYPWGPQVGNRPSDYVAAYRHVRKRFDLAGAKHVIWLFAPSTSIPGFEAYYPGSDVVDWSSTAVLNYGTMARWSQWWSFEQLFSPGYAALAALGHPIMLAEVATVHGPAAGAWYEQAQAAIERFPAVRAVVLFHDPDDRTLGSHSVDFSADRPETRDRAAGFLRAVQQPAAVTSQGGP